MALERKTDLGKITILDRVFEESLAGFCQLPELYDRVWLAQKPNVKLVFNDEEEILVFFSIYVKFGQSIKNVSKELSDKLVQDIEKRIGKYPIIATVNISGVKSNTLVRRNMDLIFEYNRVKDE